MIKEKKVPGWEKRFDLWWGKRSTTFHFMERYSCDDFDDMERVIKRIFRKLLAQELLELDNMPEGYVIWKHNGKLHGGQADSMSDIYVDDYPKDIVIGAKEILATLNQRLKEKK